MWDCSEPNIDFTMDDPVFTEKKTRRDSGAKKLLNKMTGKTTTKEVKNKTSVMGKKVGGRKLGKQAMKAAKNVDGANIFSSVSKSYLNEPFGRDSHTCAANIPF